ncbi:ataxin-7-like protein 2b isoform 1-T1 [Synchiropus picturatus]
MAAVESRNRNLDGFVGLNWSCWLDKASELFSEAVLNHQDLSKHDKTCCETMTLHKEDMHIFGQYPAHDDFYLVVCSHCGQLVKPQAFEQHCERRHGPFLKTCGQSGTSAPQRLRPERSMNVSSSREKLKADPSVEVKIDPISVSSPVQHRNSLPAVEILPLGGAMSQHQPDTTPLSTAPAVSSSSSSSKSQARNLEVPFSTTRDRRNSSSPLLGSQSHRRVCTNDDKKGCVMNKLCGVRDKDTMLTEMDLLCNKKFSSRSNDTDPLASVEKSGSPGRNLEHPKEKVKQFERSEEKKLGKKINFTSSCLKIRPQCSEEVEVRLPYPINLSEEESEEDQQEDATELAASSWHPKPLGLCTFGCRTLGCSIFTFDRRLHHLRFALSAMLEAHASTHVWKKIPKVPSNLQTHHVKPPAVQTCVRGPGLSAETVPVGQQETQSRPQNPKPLVSDNLRNFKSVGRTKAIGKAAKLSHTSGDKFQRLTRDPVRLEKQQSLHGWVNGTFSLQASDKHLSGVEINTSMPVFSNQLPQLKERPPGAQQRSQSYDHRTIGQKCKGRSKPQTLGKCQRLSSPQCWGKDQTP